MATDKKLLCRLCAVGDPERQMFDIFGEMEKELNIFDNINRHLGIWVNEDQTLPTFACVYCIEKLQSFANFHSECQNAQILLEKMCCDPESQDDIPLASLYESFQAQIPDDTLIKNEAAESEKVKEETAMDQDQQVADFLYGDADDDGIGGDADDLFSVYMSPTSPPEKKPKTKKSISKRYKSIRRRKLRKSPEDSDDGERHSKKSTLCLDKYFKFTCHVCNRECLNWYRLKSHTLEQHQQPAKVKCIVCGFGLKSRSTIYRHASNHNDPNIYSCDQCARVMKNEEALERHKMKHTAKGDAVWQCAHCPKAFTARENLKSHERVHIPKDQRYVYPCEICGTKFTTKSAVAGHKRSVHDKLKRFMCDLCGYSCSTSGELAQHRAIHFEEKSFICTMCTKSFKTSSNLKAHQDTHDTTSYQCPHCDKVLNSRRTLKKHLLVHDDLCRHICSFCNKAFKRRQTLKVHLTSHTGDTPIQCSWCTQKFAYSSAFRSHKQKVHPQEYALQQKMYQESLPKTKIENVGQKHTSTLNINTYEDDLSLEQKMFANELQSKPGGNVLVHKGDQLQQKQSDIHTQDYALQLKIYQDNLSKTKTDSVIEKQNSTLSSMDSYDDDLPLAQKMFANELQTKTGGNLVLIQKGDQLQQKHPDVHPQEYSLQQKMYQENLSKTKTGIATEKQNTSLNTFEEDLSLEQKMFASELQSKGGNIVLIHKGDQIQQKLYENGLAPLRKRHDLTLIPKQNVFDPKLFDK